MTWIRLGSFLLFFAVVFGAFGAHALKNKLPAPMLEVFETGVRYQFYHGLALLFLAWFSKDHPGALTNASGFLFFYGTCIFSGSLYIYTLTGVRWWGAVTPIGGLLFLIGWICVFIRTFKG